MLLVVDKERPLQLKLDKQQPENGESNGDPRDFLRNLQARSFTPSLTLDDVEVFLGILLEDQAIPHGILEDRVREQAEVASRVHDFLDVDAALEFLRDLAVAVEGVEEVRGGPVVFPLGDLVPAVPALIRVLDRKIDVVLREDGRLVVDGPQLHDVFVDPARGGKGKHVHDQNLPGRPDESLRDLGEELAAVRRPASVEDLAGLGSEDVDHGRLGRRQPAAVVDLSSVFSAYNVLEAGPPQRRDVPQREDVEVHVQSAEFVDGVHSDEVRLVLDLFDPLAIARSHGGCAHTSDLDGLQAQDPTGPFVLWVFADQHLLDGFFAEICVQVDGLGSEIDH